MVGQGEVPVRSGSEPALRPARRHATRWKAPPGLRSNRRRQRAAKAAGVRRPVALLFDPARTGCIEQQVGSVAAVQMPALQQEGSGPDCKKRLRLHLHLGPQPGGLPLQQIRSADTARASRTWPGRHFAVLGRPWSCFRRV